MLFSQNPLEAHRAHIASFQEHGQMAENRESGRNTRPMRDSGCHNIPALCTVRQNEAPRHSPVLHPQDDTTTHSSRCCHFLSAGAGRQRRRAYGAVSAWHLQRQRNQADLPVQQKRFVLRDPAIICPALSGNTGTAVCSCAAYLRT